MADHEEQARRGHQASRLLNDPLLTEAFTAAEAHIMRDMRTAKKPEEIQRLQIAAEQLDHIRHWLRSVLATGEIAERRLEELRTGKKRRWWA